MKTKVKLIVAIFSIAFLLANCGSKRAKSKDEAKEMAEGTWLADGGLLWKKWLIKSDGTYTEFTATPQSGKWDENPQSGKWEIVSERDINGDELFLIEFDGHSSYIRISMAKNGRLYHPSGQFGMYAEKTEENPWTHQDETLASSNNNESLNSSENNISNTDQPNLSENVEVNTTTTNTQQDQIVAPSEVENENLVQSESIQFMNSYYKAISSNNFDANKWFDGTVLNFISKTNVTPDEINRIHSNNKEFVETNSLINESTFILDRNEDGINYWNFENNFSCYRTSKKKYQSCKIFVEVGINSATKKIISYKELKVTDLKFTIDKP